VRREGLALCEGASLVEGDETFAVNLSASTNATIARGAAIGTITDDDVAGPSISSISPSIGPASGGTSVTITGSNLSGATSVTFGGTPGTITSNTATSIVVTTPAHAPGAVTVTVTTAGGSATFSGAFTYTTPAPVVTSVTPGKGPTSGGTNVTITGSNFQLGAAVLFGNLNGTVTAVTPTSITVTTPAHSGGPVDVIVRNPDGQTGAVNNGFIFNPRGDANCDGFITPGDIFYLINYLFTAGPVPACNADANSDGSTTPADIFYLINYLYTNGPAPAP